MTNPRGKIRIRLVGNDNANPEETREKWGEVFDYIFNKPISGKQSPVVGQERQELNSRDTK